MTVLNELEYERMRAEVVAAKAEATHLRRALARLDRIMSGDERSNGTDPEVIQPAVDLFHVLRSENAALKAKLAALVEALERVAHRAGCRRGMNVQELRGLLWGCEDDAKAAIAAAKETR